MFHFIVSFFPWNKCCTKKKEKKKERNHSKKKEKKKKTALNCPLQLLFCGPNWELAISFFFFFSIHHFWLFFHHQSLWLYVQKHLYDEMTWNLKVNVKKVNTCNCTWTIFVPWIITLYIKREVGNIMLWPHAMACWVRVEREWKRVGLIYGWCGSEYHGVVINTCPCLPMHPSLVWGTVTCVSKPMCSCKLDQFHSVDMCCQVWTLCKVFRKWNGFGDDVITEQPSHPCLVIHNTVCHVTP